MGFQLIAAVVNGQRRYLVVFNCEIGIEFETEEDLRTWLWSPKEIAPTDVSVQDIALESIELLAQRISNSAAGGGAGSSPPTGGAGTTTSSLPAAAPPSSLVTTITASGKRAFYRFSAFSPDRRVDPATGNFLPGTYATTDSDEREVPSGLAAVGRYALPNTAPALHVYKCTPSAGTTIRVGTVAPAYGQAGGGVEALFPTGATNVVASAPAKRSSD
jgi:hypothetical protein